MPYIVTRQYISEDRLLGHKLAELASCATILPWQITASIADKLIGERHDKKDIWDKFYNKINELHGSKTTETTEMRGED